MAKKGKKNARKATPAKQEATSKPARNELGQLLPGHTANPNGRPKGLDFRLLVQEHAEKQDISVDTAMWGVFTAMLTQARKGDVQAAKLLLDRLCTADATNINLNHSGGIASTGPPVPDTPDLLVGIRKLAVLGEELLPAGKKAGRNGKNGKK